MEISFDPAKDAANIQERGIPLAFGAVILARAVGELEDYPPGLWRGSPAGIRRGRGQMVPMRLHTPRGDVRHIITVHRIDEKRVKRWLNR